MPSDHSSLAFREYRQDCLGSQHKAVSKYETWTFSVPCERGRSEHQRLRLRIWRPWLFAILFLPEWRLFSFADWSLGSFSQEAELKLARTARSTHYCWALCFCQCNILLTWSVKTAHTLFCLSERTYDLSMWQLVLVASSRKINMIITSLQCSSAS